MAFKNLINYKKIASVLGMLALAGTQAMAQTTQQVVNDLSDDDRAAMWSTVEYYVLIFAAVCITVAIIGRILKVYDLTSQLQGKKPIQWNNIMGTMFIVFLVLGFAGAIWSFWVQGNMILPAAVSKHGVMIDSMFWTTTVLTMIVFVITQLLLFAFLFIYRHSDKRRAYFLPHNNTIEKVWTIAPAIVLTILVVFGFFTWKSIMNTTEVKGDINIDITGHQFAWELRYPGKDGKLGGKDFTKTTALNNLGVNYADPNSFDDLKVDTMVIPVNHSIRLNIFAQDVIHSVYMPYFRVQLNAVPGLPTYFKFTPTKTTMDMRVQQDDPKFEYLVYCNKICGGGHYNMKSVVRVVSEGEYLAWLTQQKLYLTDGLKKELKLAVDTTKSAPRLALNN